MVKIMDRIKYFIDRKIASGTGTLLLWLGLLTLGMLVFFAVIMTFVTSEKTVGFLDYLESFWITLSIALKPSVTTDPGWVNRIFLLLIALFGIFVLSGLVGVLASGITVKLMDLRRGRSLVLVKRHTLILGWSAKIGPVISELVLANLSESKAKIVVLADIDKIQMQEQITAISGKKNTTEVICRSGKPTDIEDIKIVNPSNAKSIIVLKESSDKDDIETIKTLLALNRTIDSKQPVPIIIEITDPQNVDAAKSIEPSVSIVKPNELITRLMVQSARQPGLSDVYSEILSFNGQEIYFHQPIFTEKKNFSEITQYYTNSVPIGIYSEENGEKLCPAHNEFLEPTDQVILISEDNNEIFVDESNLNVDPIITVSPMDTIRTPEHIWIIGWHQLGEIILKEFNDLLPDGSHVTIIYDEKYVSLPPKTSNITSKYNLNIIKGDTSKKSVIASIDTNKCTHIIVMSYRDKLLEEKADDKTLLSIVHLRTLFKGNENIFITSELINYKTKELISHSNEVSNFVASEELVSQVLVQLSENPKIEALLSQILTADGPEFHMKNVSKYPGIKTFRELSRMCLSYGEIAIGYRKNKKIILNPEKDIPIELLDSDSVIVFAEE